MLVYFSFFNYYFIYFKYIFWYFFYFLKGERGHELFKNFLRGEGIKLIFLFWKKKIVERWKWKMGWVWVFFL
jgi:hypothetical protein